MTLPPAYQKDTGGITKYSDYSQLVLKLGIRIQP